MFFNKIDTQLLFVHEFLSFMKSGVSLVEALDFLRTQSGLPRKMRGEITRVHQRVTQGQTLVDSLRSEVSFLEPWQFELIESSEQSGTLTGGLIFIQSILEKKKETNKKIFFACIHPAFYTVLFIFIYPLREFIGMIMGFFVYHDLAFVVPYLRAESKVFIVLGSIFFFLKFLPLICQSAGLKKVTDSLVLFVPIFGKLVEKMFFYQFFYVFGACYASGCSVLKAWTLSSKLCNNEAIRARMRRGEAILKGNGDLDTAFFITKLFPEKIVNLIKVGLKSGTMKDQAKQCMDIYYEQYELQAKKVEMIVPKLFYFIIVFFLIGTIIKLANGYMNTVFNQVPLDSAL